MNTDKKCLIRVNPWLKLTYFFKPSPVSLFTCKSRRDKGTDDIEREFNSNNPSAQTEHVAIVVFA